MSMKSERRRGRMCGRWNLVIPLRRQTVGIHVTIVAVLINWKGLFLFFPCFRSFSLGSSLLPEFQLGSIHRGQKTRGRGSMLAKTVTGCDAEIVGLPLFGGKTRPIDANRSIKSNGSPTSRGSKAIGGG